MYVEFWVLYILLVLAGMQVGNFLYWCWEIAQMYRRRGLEPPFTISGAGR